MLSCADVIGFCFDFLEGSLPEADRVRFERHLALCQECVAFFDTYRKTPEITREALATDMPPAVRQAIRAFLKQRC